MQLRSAACWAGLKSSGKQQGREGIFIYLFIYLFWEGIFIIETSIIIIVLVILYCAYIGRKKCELQLVGMARKQI